MSHTNLDIEIDKILLFLHFRLGDRFTIPKLKKIQHADSAISRLGYRGFLLGGKIATLLSREGSIFKASAQAHPSMLDVKDAEKVRIPMCVLPSMDEVIEPMEEWLKVLHAASPKSYSETFGDQVHGWVTSRYQLPLIIPLKFPSLALFLKIRFEWGS